MKGDGKKSFPFFMLKLVLRNLNFIRTRVKHRLNLAFNRHLYLNYLTKVRYLPLSFF